MPELPETRGAHLRQVNHILSVLIREIKAENWTSLNRAIRVARTLLVHYLNPSEDTEHSKRVNIKLHPVETPPKEVIQDLERCQRYIDEVLAYEEDELTSQETENLGIVDTYLSLLLPWVDHRFILEKIELRELGPTTFDSVLPLLFEMDNHD